MILAIESASSELSIALAAPDGEPLAHDAWRSAQRQSAELMPRVLDLLAQGGHGLEALTAVAVGTGPGSFTGLRVGMSAAKGIAVAAGLPIVGVPSLEAWLAADPQARAAVTRAGAREAWLLPRGAAEPVLIDAESLPDAAREERVAAPAELAEAFGLAGAQPPSGAAVAIGRLAAARLATAPGGDDPARLEPVYRRAPRGLATAEAR